MPRDSLRTLQSSWPFKRDCHQENSSLFREVAAACPGQKATAKNSLAPGRQPAVHLSAHIGIRRVAGSGGHGAACARCWKAPRGFHLAGQGWTAKAVTPGSHVPQATSRTVAGDRASADRQDGTVPPGTRGRSDALPLGSLPPPPSAAWCANPGSSGDTHSASPVSPRSGSKELTTSATRQHAHPWSACSHIICFSSLLCV